MGLKGFGRCATKSAETRKERRAEKNPLVAVIGGFKPAGLFRL
jgi:hypothetical protein